MLLQSAVLIFSSASILLFSVNNYLWQSSDINWNRTKTIHQCIYEDKHKQSFKLISMQNFFEVNLVQNSDTSCINPYFPSIHIKTDCDHTAWFHIVVTNSEDIELQEFIDAQKESYPFYTLEKDFYDAPTWRYTLFSKPLSFWKGRAYAVKIDHNTKTIKCIGGIQWGFTLSYFHFRPQIIIPSGLTTQHWEQDWLIFKNKLPDYSNKN